MKQITTLLLLVIFASSSCKKSENADTGSSGRIAGKWNWVKTTRGWSPTINPQTENYNEQIVFAEGGSYTLLRNNAVVQTGTFAIDSISPDHFRFTIDGNTSLLYFTTASKFSYGDGVTDGYQYYYER